MRKHFMANLLSSATKELYTEICNDFPDIAKVEQYIAAGADLNYQAEEDGYTPLMLAVDKDDETLVKYLLEAGANPLVKNYHQEIASQLALRHSPIYQLLKNYELVFLAADNDVVSVKSVLAEGANVNFQGQEGYCALLIAAEQNCLELFQLLLCHRADLSLKRDDGMGIFELAGNARILGAIRSLITEHTRAIDKQNSRE